MGMYNDILCEYPLPDYKGNGNLQTKDFECDCLTEYKITKDGRLLRFEFDEEIIPEDERPLCKNKPPEERTAFDKACGFLRNRNTEWKDTNFHGILRMHDICYDVSIKFTDGKLVSIEVVQ